MGQIAVALRLAGATGLLIGVTFACGNDTASDNDDGDGGSGGTSTSGTASGSGGNDGSTSGDAGGSGGSGTVATTTASATASSTTSSATSGGSGGAPPEPIAGLAEACAADDDCEDDLICISAESNSLIEGGPANGFCTKPCDSSDCGSAAACLTFSENSYCVPICGIADGVQDCAERPDVICDVLPASTGISCGADVDCDTNQICLDGVCVFGLPVCLPKCRADSDCPDGRFCDPGIGECVDEAPEGLGLTEICDPDADNECLGYCDSQLDPPRCMQICSYGIYPACNSDSIDMGTAECLIPYWADTGDPGDAGLCYPLCDCTSDCAEDLVCVSFESLGGDGDIRGRAGICGPTPSDETLEILDCE